MIFSLGFGLQQQLQPLPVGETGVASGKGLLGRPSKATASSRSFSAKRRLLFTAEAPWSARGLALSRLAGGSRAKGSPPAGGKQCVSDRDPDGRRRPGKAGEK